MFIWTESELQAVLNSSPVEPLVPLGGEGARGDHADDKGNALRLGVPRPRRLHGLDRRVRRRLQGILRQLGKAGQFVGHPSFDC